LTLTLFGCDGLLSVMIVTTRLERCKFAPVKGFEEAAMRIKPAEHSRDTFRSP